MARIIGNVFLMLVFASTVLSASAPDISMRMINREDGSPLMQAGIGQPFVIEVLVTDIARVGQYPVVKGLESFPAKNVGINIKTVNGRTTACYSYEVRIDTAGTYDIGPAELIDGRQTLQSSVLHIIVGDQAVGQSKSQKKENKKALVFMRLSADKSKVVVGERITCSLRFYTSHSNATIKQLIEQEVTHLVRKQMHGPYEGTEHIDGAEYQYAEWQWYVYPKNSGKQVIPAYGADYEVQTERDNYWGGLGRFFGSRVDTKRIYSNALSIDVQPLPNHTKPIDAVGSFSSMNVIANPPVAQQGEGITVTIQITGDGDPETTKCPVLRGLPDSFKWYESKKMVSDPEESNKKQLLSFEFVVQGLKQGSFQIPEQSFHYYDVNRHEYRTLKSVPVTITIMPRAEKKNRSSHPSNSKDSEDVQETIAPLQSVACGGLCDAYALPWWIIMVLALMPIIGCMGYAIAHTIRIYRSARMARTSSARAFTDAQRALRAARVQDLYAIIVGAIAARCVISPASVSAEFIENQFAKKNSSELERSQWRIFFEKIMQCAYSNESTADNQLLNEAEQWLKRLNEYFPHNEF